MSSWWRHQMETFSALLAICAGNSPVPGEFPAHRPVTQSFEFSLICARMNGWINNGDAGDLRRHRAHYGVTVMSYVRSVFNQHTTNLRVSAILTFGCLVLFVFLVYDGPANHPRISQRERNYIEAGTGHLDEVSSCYKSLDMFKLYPFC